MRESVKELIERAKRSSAAMHWETSRAEAMKKRPPEADEQLKKDLAEAKAALKKADAALKTAEARRDKALEQLAVAESEAEELGSNKASMEEKAEKALAKAERAKMLAAAAENQRMSAEARQVEAEAARAAAESSSRASGDARLMAEQKVAEALQMIDGLRAQVVMSESNRASDAVKARGELDRMRSQVMTSHVLDIVPNRNSRGLITYLEVQIGTDRFRVVPVRNAAGLIVNMKREEV